MSEVPLNFNGILIREKQPGLSQIDMDFYERVVRQINDLESERSGAEPDRYEDITDCIEVMRRQAVDIMDIRMLKLIRMASSQSAKRIKNDAPAMTHEELKFYNALISLITAWRQDCIDLVTGNKPVKTRARTVPVQEPDREYVVLRLLRNVPTFVGLDFRNYTLAKEEVAVVPAANAKALIMRKAAVQIVMK